MRTVWGLAIAGLAVASPLQAQNARGLVERVAVAMGGSRRVLSVKTLMLRGSGENYNLGQNRTPDADLPVYAVTKFVRAIDFRNARWRQDQTREPKFITANTAPQRQRTGFDVVAYDITSDTSMRRLGPRQTVDRRAELLYHPIGFIQAALKRGAKLSEDAARGAERIVNLDVDGERYTMTIDNRTMLPLQIERTVANASLGDVPLTNEFQKWYTVSDILVPIQVTQRIDRRWKLSDMTFDGVTVNRDVGDITAPESVRNAPLVTPQVNVTADSIAPGVWFLAGGSHHSVLIEMSDRLVLVEAPQSDDRTLAVIAKAKSVVPGKPLTTLVNTHHHFDHSGGVRGAIAQGLTVITHEKNKAFFEDLARRRFSIVPDQLARTPRAPVVQGVSGKRSLTDGVRTVDIYGIEGSAHSESMLVVHLPAEKILIEADLYTPPAPNLPNPTPAPFAPDLLENVGRLNLAVDRIVPIHGRIVPFTDLSAAAVNGP